MLIRCPECNNEVSDKAEVCPHCGIKIAGNPEITGTLTGTGSQQVPMQPKPQNKKSHAVWIVSLIIAVAVVGMVYYFNVNAEKEKEREAYEYALQSTDPMVLQNYLSRYQDAPREHRDSINALLTQIKMDDNEWQNAVNSGSRGALMQYIADNPDSPHLAEAKNKVDSIDYNQAMRDYKSSHAIEILQKYVTQHPNGRYVETIQEIIGELKSIELSPEELKKAKDVCRKFFQAINARNESKLLSTVTDFLASFLNRSGVSNEDVVSFMNKLYKDDITNMNWYMMDNFKAEKVDNGEGGKNVRVQFGAEQHIERTDPSKEKLAKYIISAEITPDWRITKMNMKKQVLSE